VLLEIARKIRKVVGQPILMHKIESDDEPPVPAQEEADGLELIVQRAKRTRRGIRGLSSYMTPSHAGRRACLPPSAGRTVPSQVDWPVKISSSE
jgi:hypothetical protein